MIPKPIDQITKADIEALQANAVAEKRTIDYKLTLPGMKDKAKKEFLADVSSFANAAGGDLIFGVAEAGGVPAAMPGLAVIDLDAEKLRLENMMRDGIEPRLPGVQIHTVAGFPDGPVLILRVPKSWASPHVVKFETFRFFSRNSSGKYPMDVGELRAAFAASEALGERLQRFRTDRLAKIIAGETPVPLHDEGKLVLHLLPFSSFNLGTHIDARLQQVLIGRLRPMGMSGWNHRHNFDGFVTFDGRQKDEWMSCSYCQFFRNGSIESVYGLLTTTNDNRRLISPGYEQYIVESLNLCLGALKEIGVPLPILACMSMVGVKGAELYLGRGVFRHTGTSIDRDVLLLPETVLEQYDVNPAAAMRPAFDAAWNAAGFERCFNFDGQGNWKPRQ